MIHRDRMWTVRFDLSGEEWAPLEPLVPCHGGICRNVMSLIRRSIIGSVAGRGAASERISSTNWLRNRATALSDGQHHREDPPRGQRRKRGEKNQAIGISRGGRSTKIHAIVDSKGRPLDFIVTGGHVHDSQLVEDVLNTPSPPLAVSADKAYDSQRIRQQIGDEGALPVIPSHGNAVRKAYRPERIYRRRHKIVDHRQTRQKMSAYPLSLCHAKDFARINIQQRYAQADIHRAWTSGLARCSTSRRAAPRQALHRNERLRGKLAFAKAGERFFHFVRAYNFARRLKTLKGFTPYEHICRRWTKEPERFAPNPLHQVPSMQTFFFRSIHISELSSVQVWSPEPKNCVLSNSARFTRLSEILRDSCGICFKVSRPPKA